MSRPYGLYDDDMTGLLAHKFGRIQMAYTDQHMSPTLQLVIFHTPSTHPIITWIELISPHTDLVMTYHI